MDHEHRDWNGRFHVRLKMGIVRAAAFLQERGSIAPWQDAFALRFLCFCYSDGWAQAQAVPVKPESAADNMAEISLGQSAVPLYGPWKFTIGDSPVDPVTHAPRPKLSHAKCFHFPDGLLRSSTGSSMHWFTLLACYNKNGS